MIPGQLVLYEHKGGRYSPCQLHITAHIPEIIIDAPGLPFNVSVLQILLICVVDRIRGSGIQRLLEEIAGLPLYIIGIYAEDIIADCRCILFKRI